MPRKIYTERDIEDMARKGVRELALRDDIYLTDLARERAERLGIALRPIAPAHGDLAGSQPPSMYDRTASASALTPSEREQLVQKVKAGVLAKAGAVLDPGAVESIARRIVDQL